MYTNGSMTIYKSFYDSENDIDTYKRLIIDSIFWNSREGYIKHKTNNSSDDKATAFVSLDSSVSEGNSVSKMFDGAISLGDLAVEGIGPEIDRPRDLEHHYTVTSVDFKNFGSRHMRHWVVNFK